MKTKPTADDRRARVADLRARLEEWEAQADDDTLERAFALFGAKYSERNALLIAMQRPRARDVAGFRAWLDRGRCVRKGERGLAILAPAGTYATGEQPDADDGNGDDTPVKTRQAFKITHVFDISQTDALPAEVAS